jgi:hypothetical protein
MSEFERNTVGPDRAAAFRAFVDDARRSLLRVAIGELLLASMTAALVATGLAVVALVLLPFSDGLRATLLGLIGASVVVTAALVWRRRVSPLSGDAVVARALEEALRRRGQHAAGDVIGAVEMLGDDEASRALVLAHVAAVARTLESSGARGEVLATAIAAARATLISFALTLVTVLVLAGVAGDAVKERLLRLFDGEAAEQAALMAALHRPPLVVDLTLTLRFPAYMARAEQKLTGASGDIVAPRGTEVFVEGRADHAARAAAILYGEREIALTVTGERDLKGAFVVDEQGTYRFRVTGMNGRDELSPVARRITIEPDREPEVALAAPADDRVIDLEEVIPLAFSAKDDFGVTAFRLVVVRQGSGQEGKRKDLMSADAAPRELAGRASFRADELGARPGDRLSVFVEALDNDTVGGPKAGRSPTRVLTVFSPAEHHRALIEKERALLDLMIDTLAFALEHAMPKDIKSDVERARAIDDQAEGARKSAAVVAALDALKDEMVKDPLSPDDVRRALAHMRSDLDRLTRNLEGLTKGARSNIASARQVPAYVFQHLRTYQTELTGALERHILYLDDLLNAQRLDEARSLADEMKRTQDALKELLTKYKESPDDETRAAILSEIKRLKEQMDSLAERLSELEQDVPDEHLNEEAFRSDEMLAETSDLDQLIEEGKIDEALAALEKMMSGTEKLTDDLEKSRDELGGDEYAEVREKMRDFTDELKAVTAAQEELERRSERMLESARKEAMRKLEKEQKGLLDELIAKARAASDAIKKIDPRALFAPEQEEAAYAEARVADLLFALAAKDIDDALQAAREAEASTLEAERQVSDRSRGRFSTANERTRQARERLEEARPLLEEVREKLEELLPEPSEMLDKNQRAQMKRDAKEQGELRERTAKLIEKMRDISAELPLFGPSHDTQVGEAAAAMRDAAQRLNREDLREGRRAQAKAMQSLGALEQALEEMAQGQGQSGGIPMPLPSSGSESGNEEGNGKRPHDDEVEIPGAEDFQTPERFRREILEAMREDAPPQWVEEVKRYYEELIK